LTQWIRSAGQRNIDALVKVGDYYYHGLGVSEDSDALRFEKAARYYQSAADTQMSALAMWNLGWMYENGVGVPQVCFGCYRNLDLHHWARISILPNVTMTWLLKPARKLTYPCFSHWESSTFAVFGIQ
jgi:SEL1 protein